MQTTQARKTKGAARRGRANSAGPTPAAVGGQSAAPVIRLRSLVIKDVQKVHGELREMLQADTRFSVDVSELRELDGAGVQLLLALQIEMVARGWPPPLQNETAVVSRALATLGLRDTLRFMNSRD